jgi:hypothetical protein
MFTLDLVSMNTSVDNGEINTRDTLAQAKLFHDKSVRFSVM